jgi:hypothetical protein
MYSSAFVRQYYYTRKIKKICRKNAILPDITLTLTFRETAPIAGHASFAKPKLTLAIWAAYFILCLLPLHSTGLESRRRWVTEPVDHNLSRDFTYFTTISVAVSVPIRPLTFDSLWPTRGVDGRLT